MPAWSEWHLNIISKARSDLRARLWRGLLSLAALPYAGVVSIRNGLFDHGWRRSQRAACPVVSVGNLTVGGTGKTPAVEMIARHLRTAGHRVAILSRGYGATGGRNDEALLLEENLPDVPHLQGPDRVELARIAAEELEAEVLLLDDGFQHRRLCRDLDIVLIDATCPWGYGWVLPRGLLREPRRGLRRADVVLLTRCDQIDEAQLAELRAEAARLAPHAPILESRHVSEVLRDVDGRELAVEHLRGAPVAAFCGIGRPDSFFRQLAALGARLTATRIFPDHHAYGRDDVTSLEGWARQQPGDVLLITTHKDLVKLRCAELAERPLWALRVRLDVTVGRLQLERRLSSLMTEDAHGSHPSLSAV
ncbi:MAG TPA: tetraacyldisaccharide 4'-kinase [Gemmatales bacterium]|nr:tetraacyldisaccharide 4'-kinase [Gemmatales bacterium]